MQLEDIKKAFNRSLVLTFSLKKLTLVFIVLAMCGLMAVFCRGVAVHAGDWVVMSLTFIPILLSAGVLLALGIILVRVYHDEIKDIPVNYWGVLSKSWELMIGASYFSIPLILIYLVFWMVLGMFLLLREIPGLGDIVGVVLTPGPFLLNLGAVLLCVLHVAILFFVTPALALRSSSRMRISQVVLKRLESDPFTNVLLILVALLPLAAFVGLLTIAAVLTGSWYFEAGGSLYIAMQWFFVMLPYTALMAPGIVFFFQFAAESHVLIQRQLRKSIGD